MGHEAERAVQTRGLLGVIFPASRAASVPGLLVWSSGLSAFPLWAPSAGKEHGDILQGSLTKGVQQACARG